MTTGNTIDSLDQRLTVLEDRVHNEVATREQVEELKNEISELSNKFDSSREDSDGKFVDLTNRYADIMKGIQEILSRP